ncbi:CLUMA_CG004926, isoform A [Clunio marinus]|uniref:CLUMA_CG004926, isoform A n=1 Tax=Clunio marinus TaxID=568069 RepID=A0A1J1HXJ9_9DIPT|nr:CLUMA_CG004926, isoform A [Clunio marinus]
MGEPQIEDVLKNIYDLYEGPDLALKEKASTWLADFQKSIYSWKVADHLLQQKNDLNSCYFAAQTMRSKIQHSFHELPESSHTSLRDSIVSHIEHITLETNPIITKQLCLALSNLVLLMASWEKPIEFLLEKFSSKHDSIQPLLLTLTYIPEELDARYLRLGDNRRKQIIKELESSSPILINFLQSCLTNSDGAFAQKIQIDVISCFTSWVKMNCIPLSDASGSYVFSYAFQILVNPAVSKLIKDVIFIVKSISCFERMFRILQTPNVSWEATEAALFIMEATARNIYTEEDRIAPQVIEAILQLPDNCHIAIRYTSVNILGQLCDWIAAHPTVLERVLNFLLNALQRKESLASASAQSLQLICSACHRDMIHHISGLIEIARCLEMFEIAPDAAIVLLKGIAIIINRLPSEQILNVMRQLCGFQITHIHMLMEKDNKTDPTQWIDRLASIYRHVNPKLEKNQQQENPATIVILEHWPELSRMIDCYQHDAKIMERIVRCIRYAIRCISEQSLPILEPLVKQMVEVYATHTHSCLLYLGSILVDEFGHDMRCVNGLLKMLEAFIEPTFNILQMENGLKNHPDTVDDFFRLAVRYIQRMPLHFLQSPIVSPIIQCATLACTLDHRDANASVMKFISNLLAHGKPNGNSEIRPFVQHIVELQGETLVGNLLYSSIFCLHHNMLGDVADALLEIKIINNDAFGESVQKSLSQLPRKNAGGSVTATDTQMAEFYQCITKANVSVRQVTHALDDFCRLFR